MKGLAMSTLSARLTILRRPFAPLRLLVRLAALRRARRDLDRLDDHLLNDIGIPPDRARAEAARPIWDVPPTWRQ
jgi:uncharacterized protein YjiS (DUF1127 family)